MPEPQPPTEALTAQQRIDSICGEFERQQRSGLRPRWKAFLEQLSGEHRAALFQKLLALDCRDRRARGETPSVEDYSSAAPEFEELVRSYLAELESPPTTAGSTVVAETQVFSHSLPEQSTRLPVIPGYEVLEYVARGGMGVVYRAVDKKLAREVAIKMPRTGYIGGEQDKERFVREAVAAARLRHPNICPVFEVREADGQPYIAMAFIRGATLKIWRQQSNAKPRQVAELMAVIARAVQAAHDQEVIHRDLKPSNIMVETRGGQPILMDFGLAKDLSHNDGLTMSGDLIGTPAYMAPEQAAGHASEVGKHSDVYALGAILYELLSGKAPFAGTLAEVLQQVQQTEPASIRRSNSLVHRDLETICVKAMAKRPAERYKSAGAFAEDLERFARGEPILARRQGWLKSSLRVVRKYPVVCGLSAVLIVVLGFGAAAFPEIQRQFQITQLAQRLQSNLQDRNWQPASLSTLDELLGKLNELAPNETATYRGQVTVRLERYLDDYVARPRLNESDRQAIDAAVAILESRDPARGAERARAADRRFGRWEKIAELKPPFERAAELLPELAVSADGEALSSTAKTDSERNFLSAQACEGNYQVEATFDLPRGQICGAVLYSRAVQTGGVSSIAVSPDGKWIAAGSSEGGPIRVWDSESAAEVFTLAGHTGAVGGLAFGPGYLVSTGRDGLIKVWDLPRRTLAQSASVGPRDAPTMFTPPLVVAGGRAYVGVNDGIVCFALPKLTPEAPLSVGKPVQRLAISADGRRLAAGTSSGDVEMWEINGPKLLWSQLMQARTVGALALRGDGRVLACSTPGGQIRLFDATTGRLQTTLATHESGAQSFAFDPTGNTLASGHDTAAFKLWDLAAGQARATHQFRKQAARALAFEPGGAWLMLGTEKGTLHQLDAGSGHERWSLANQSYTFAVKRQADGAAVVQIMRNGVVLREEVQPLASGPVRLVARREHEALQLQINQNPPLRFVDHFPPRTVEGGVWGVRLSAAARMNDLILRRSLSPTAGSPLEIGEREFRAGRFQAAWERFQDQLASGGEENDAVRQEARLKSALCLLRLNRKQEAIAQLQELSGAGGEPTPSITFARFQLWLALAKDNRWPAADALAPTIELEHPYDAMSQVIALDLQQELFDLYARGVARRNSPLVSGSAQRLETMLKLTEYFRFRADRLGQLHWNILESLRMAGREERARELGGKVLAEVQRQAWLNALPRSSDLYIADQWHRAGWLARWLQTPEPLETALDALLAPKDSAPIELRGSQWGLVLERARLHAGRGDWTRTADLLAPMWAARDDAEQILDMRLRGALLYGISLRRLSRPEEAKEVFRTMARDPEVEDRAADLADQTAERALDLLTLFSVADELSDPFLNDFFALARNRAGGSAGADEILKQFPLVPDVMRRVRQSPRGEAFAEQIAIGDLLFNQQFKQLLMLYAYQLILDGAVADTSPADDELVWTLARKGFENYSANKISLPTFLQLGLAWKGVPAPLGWKFVFNGVPSDMKAASAYVLGLRFLRREQPAVARQLLQLAVEYSGSEETLRALAAGRLATLDVP